MGILKRFLVIILLISYLPILADEEYNADVYFADYQIDDSIVNSIIEYSDSLININPKKSDSLIFQLYDDVFSDTLSSEIVKAEVLHHIGKHLVERGEYQTGIDSLQRSYNIRLKETPNDTNSLCKTLVFIGNGYFGLRMSDSAYRYYNIVRHQLQEREIYDINLFHSVINIGIIYASMDVFDTALLYFDSAMTVLDSAGLHDSLDLSALYYYNYALLNTYSGNLKEADKYYKISSEQYTKLDGEINIRIAGILNNLGLNHYYAYEMSKAELYFKRSLEVYELLEDQVPEKISHIYYNLSAIARENSEYQNAIEYCLEGLSVTPTDDLKLRLYINLAKSYNDLNEKEKANNYFLEALSLMGSEKVTQIRKQQILLEYALFLKESSNPTMSYGYFKRAAEEAKILNGVNSRNFGNQLLELGYYFIDIARNPDSAYKHFSESSAIFNELTSDDNIDNFNKINQKRAEIGIAESYHLQYELSKKVVFLKYADSVYADVLNQTEKIIMNLSTANKLVVISTMNDVYTKAVDCSYELYILTNETKYISQLFNYMERSKSSALLAEVNSENALKTSDIPTEIFEYEKNIKDKVNNFRQMIENERSQAEPNQGMLSFYESNLLSLLVEYDSLISDIEQSFPKYFSVKYQSDIIDISEIQEYLKSDQAVLEYMMSDSILYLLAITKEEVSLHKTNLDQTFFNCINDIISVKSLKLSDQNKARYYQFKSDSYELWRVLIEPVDKLIDGKRLIIIPDGLLGYLPFDILIEYDFETETINYRDLPYLIRNHAISYSYSATLRYNTYFEKTKDPAVSNIVAFAPTYKNNKDSTLILDELDEAKSEVKNLVRSYGGKAFIDNRATKINFEKNADKSNIIHLAMHAIINDSLPLQSKLVFYNDSHDTKAGYMYTHEIFNQNINASMVTLSACNTGSGEFRKGEGIMSLSRGFVYAGVPSIVMTLWEVQDVTGSKIMDRFYGNLFDGMTKDVALQKAKLSVLKESNMANSHPFFWSAYIINGDVSQIDNQSEEKSANYRFITLAAIAFISILIYRFLKSRKARRNE